MKKTITYLIVLVALLFANLGASAQGGLAPLVNSSHTYTIVPESGSNTLLWSVSPATGYTINTAVNTASVNITWTSAAIYTLTFSETNGTSCTTIKTATVIVGANMFDVSTSSPSAMCNTATGQVNYVGSTATTSISFTVDMTTANTSWSPDWEIEFTLTPSGTQTISNVVVSTGTLSGPGPYTVTDIPSASGAQTMTITFDVDGNIYAPYTVDLAITSAKELQYDTPDIDSDDWAATQNINEVPNTSAITTD